MESVLLPEAKRALRVLAAVDGSEPALRACQTAADLLGRRHADIRLLVVLSFEIDPYTLLGEEFADTPERLRLVREAVERTTAEPRSVFEKAGHRVSATHTFGNTAEEILKEVTEWRADLVVMGRRGLSGASRWLMGSVSDRVVRHAHVPVLVVP